MLRKELSQLYKQREAINIKIQKIIDEISAQESVMRNSVVLFDGGLDKGTGQPGTLLLNKKGQYLRILRTYRGNYNVFSAPVGNKNNMEFLPATSALKAGYTEPVYVKKGVRLKMKFNNINAARQWFGQQ